MDQDQKDVCIKILFLKTFFLIRILIFKYFYQANKTKSIEALNSSNNEPPCEQLKSAFKRKQNDFIDDTEPCYSCDESSLSKNERKVKRIADDRNYPEYNRTSSLKMPNQCHYYEHEIDQGSIGSDDGANLRDFSGPESPNNISSLRETNSASTSSCSLSSCCSNEYTPIYDGSNVQRLDLPQKLPESLNGSFYNNADFPQQYSYNNKEAFLNQQNIYPRPMPSYINFNNHFESDYRMPNSHIYFISVPTMPPTYFRTNSTQRFDF